MAFGRRAHLLGVTALASGLIAAGCGGGDDGGGEAPGKQDSAAQANAASKKESVAQAGAPGKARFVAQANEICTQGNAELDASAQESLGQGPAPPEDRDAFASETIVPNVRGQIDDIRELRIPEGDEDTVNGFLDEIEGILDRLERDPASFSVDPFAQVKEDFAAYGLTACGPNVGG